MDHHSTIVLRDASLSNSGCDFFQSVAGGKTGKKDRKKERGKKDRKKERGKKARKKERKYTRVQRVSFPPIYLFFLFPRVSQRHVSLGLDGVHT